MTDFSIFVVSNNEEKAKKVIGNIKPLRPEFFNGSSYDSFSALINRCILHCNTEKVVICSDRVLPKPKNVHKLVRILDSGFSFVGLYRWAFFGMWKDTIRRVGPLDERFISGGYEDCDYMRRIKLNNLAYYESEEVPYTRGISRWDDTIAKNHFSSKWVDYNEVTLKLLPEETYDYDFGPMTYNVYLPWDKSVMMKKSQSWSLRPIYKVSI